HRHDGDLRAEAVLELQGELEGVLVGRVDDVLDLGAVERLLDGVDGEVRRIRRHLHANGHVQRAAAATQQEGALVAVFGRGGGRGDGRSHDSPGGLAPAAVAGPRCGDLEVRFKRNAEAAALSTQDKGNAENDPPRLHQVADDADVAQ